MELVHIFNITFNELYDLVKTESYRFYSSIAHVSYHVNHPTKTRYHIIEGFYIAEHPYRKFHTNLYLFQKFIRT